MSASMQPVRALRWLRLWPRARMSGLTMLRMLSWLTILVSAFAHAATIEQPRAFGHVLGDVLTQRVLLQVDGREVSATALPPPERVGLWFERRPARTEKDGEGRRWLAIDYQVINSPRSLGAATLPALSIPVDSGAPLALPQWPVSIGPLAPAQAPAEGAPQSMRPDREVAPLPAAPAERQLRWSSAALATVLLAWLGWWGARQWRDARTLPFARAMRELRRLDAGSDESWLALHRAIDASAGRVVRSESLPGLFAEAPHLLSMRARLEDFYRRSDQRFFAGVRNAQTYPLLDLCRALRKAEMTAPRPASTPADPPRGCGPAWERPGARPASHSHNPPLRQSATDHAP